MRRSAFFVLAAVAFDLGAVGNAFGGDLGRPPVDAPPPPPVYYGWTGCYAGLNAGGLWGHINSAADGSAGLTAGAQVG